MDSRIEEVARKLWIAYRGAGSWDGLNEGERDIFREMARVGQRLVEDEREACAKALQGRARDAEDARDFVRQAIDDPASLLRARQ